MQIPSEVLWTRTLGINLAHGKIWYSPMAFNGIFCANISALISKMERKLM